MEAPIADDSEDLVPLGAVLSIWNHQDEQALEVANNFTPRRLDLERERGLIGRILLDPSRFDEVLALGVTPAHFSEERAADLFTAMLQVRAAGRDVTPAEVADEADRMGASQDAARLAVSLETLARSRMSAESIAGDAEAILRRHRRDQLRRACRRGEARAARGHDPDDIEHELHQALKTTDRRGKRASIRDLARAAERTILSGGMRGLRLPWKRLDRLTRGFQVGNVTIVGARPKMGKTSFMLQVALFWALELGIKVGILSAEMTGLQLTVRLILQHARVRFFEDEETGDLFVRKRDVQAVVDAATEIGDSPLIEIVECPGPTVPRLEAEARTLVQEGCGALFFDYLQLVRGKTRGNDLIEEASQACMSVALEHRVPFVVLSQLNRECESRTDKRPVMSDLRGAGAIEQDAALILLLYREEVYLKEKTAEEDKGMAEIIVGANRNGRMGMERLGFDDECTRFVDTTAEEWPPSHRGAP